MQLISARTANRAKSRPVNAFNPSGRIRRGFMGCQASSQGITSILAVTNDLLLQRHAQALTMAVRFGLRETAQLAISHPTPATLKDAFDSVDRVQGACQSVRRRMRRTGAADVLAGVQVFLAGVKTGIAELESGLERITLLPCSAPDYPEDEQ